MSSSKEIKNKITTIESTKKITHAMEMLSASKMKKSQSTMRASRPFAAAITELISSVAYNCIGEHHFFIKREEINVGLLIIGTDRGLCAGLNSSLFRKCWDYIKTWKTTHADSIIKIATIGEKAKIFFGAKCAYQILASQEKIGEHPTMQHLIGVIKVLLEEYKEQKIDRVYIAYNEFISTLKQKPVIKQLLPIANNDLLTSRQLPTEYIFEPNAKNLLDILLNRYLESLVYQGVIENIASEQSARMLAMKNATDNADQIIYDLNLHYNKARQANITKEITEIVSGSAAV
jgi:F-type H+-transporting ATPase subunit gamma